MLEKHAVGMVVSDAYRRGPLREICCESLTFLLKWGSNGKGYSAEMALSIESLFKVFMRS